MKIRYICLALLVVLCLTACGNGLKKPEPTPTAAPRKVLMISGSGTVTAILSGVKATFEADVPGYSLNILSGSSTGGGVEGILKGALDVAAMARAAKDEETAQGVMYAEFGQSGVAVFTHPDVGLTNLTKEQVQGIFAGEIVNWAEVGGPDQGIILCVRDESDSSTQSLREVFLGDTLFPATALVQTSQSDMQAVVAATPGAVGFGAWPAALAVKAEVKGLSLDGVAPGDAANPMKIPVGIGYMQARQADVQPLMDWLLSEKGRAALEKLEVITE
ncbi:MAG TPA: substrate-binding domain-containing protein [Anaerolineae bacterium]|nr:substrate-binding domain-containing protein [Anaerolineae bacterium]